MPGKHRHFQDPEVGCCGKYFLFGFNIVFWVSAGSASRPALGRGTRQPQFLGRGDPPQELATEDCPRPLPPQFSVPKNYSRGTRGGTQSQRRSGGGRGGLGVSRCSPKLGRKRGRRLPEDCRGAVVAG